MSDYKTEALLAVRDLLKLSSGFAPDAIKICERALQGPPDEEEFISPCCGEPFDRDYLGQIIPPWRMGVSLLSTEGKRRKIVLFFC